MIKLQWSILNVLGFTVICALAGCNGGSPSSSQTLQCSFSKGVKQGQCPTLVVGDTGMIGEIDHNGNLSVHHAAINGIRAIKTINQDGSYITVGDSGVINYCQVGKDCMTVKSGVIQTLHGIALHDGKYVVVGDAGTVLVSTDGLNWEQQLSNTGENLNAIIYASNKFIAVGEQGAILDSDDGKTWHSLSPLTPNSLQAITVGNGVILATGDKGTILNSRDGISWQLQHNSVAASLNAIVYANDSFVIAGSSGVAMISQDGINWSTNYDALSANYTAIIYAKDKYIRVGNVGKSFGQVMAVASYSSDGINWNNSEYFVNNKGLNAIAFVKDKFIAGGAKTSSAFFDVKGGILLDSSDGIEWNIAVGSTEYLKAVVRGNNGKVVAVGYLSGLTKTGTVINSGLIFMSDNNGQSWKSVDASNTNGLRDIFFGKGKFVAVGNKGKIIYSQDGINWLNAFSGTSNDLYAITYAESKFVASGKKGTILVSSDGQTWTTAQSSTGNGILSMTYNTGIFVASGEVGTIITSVDGYSWSTQTSNTNYNLGGLSYGNGRFLSLGIGGAISPGSEFIDSTDGNTWNKVTTNVKSRALNVLAFDGTSFIAGGDNGNILLSQDGKIWETLPLFNGVSFSGIER